MENTAMGEVVDELIEKRDAKEKEEAQMEEAKKAEELKKLEENKEQSSFEEVPLTEMETLKAENIGLQQALLQEKKAAAGQQLEFLALSIKRRVGAPEDAAIQFDPQNLKSVRIAKPSSGVSG